MKVEINGHQENVENGVSIRKLLETRGINPNLVACELNLTILKRANLGTTHLQEGDKLEIIQMIGGG